MTHEKCRGVFTDALYDLLEPGVRKEFESHLRECENCRKEFHLMEETLRVMSLRRREEPADREWAGYWDKLAGRLAVEEKTKRGRIFRLVPESLQFRPHTAWIYGAAAVLLLAAGFILGRMYFVQPQESNRNELAHVTGQSGTEDSVSRVAFAYLQRSKNLLLGVINSDGSAGSPQDYSQEQRVSRDLLEKAQFLKVALAENDQQHLLRLIKDLEVILLQLANTEIRPGVPVVELVKNGVDQKSILLKINLMEMERDSRRHQPQTTKKSS